MPDMIITATDIGTRKDATVTATLNGWDLVSIEALPLGLTYPAITYRLHTPVHAADAAFIDATGVGRPVFDELHNRNPHLVGISITSGKQATLTPPVWHVPKSILMDALAQAFNRGVLTVNNCAEPGRSALRDEMVHFMRDGNKSGAANGHHDDYVLALAMAVFGKVAMPDRSSNVVPFKRPA